MEIHDMKICEKDGYIEINEVNDFDLDHILDCGQCFRWERQEAGTYIGTAFGKIAELQYDSGSNTLKMYNTCREDFENIWFDYFDLSRDYSQIKTRLAQGDAIMSEAIDYGAGIRILNQEKWETLISFIISQNNNIPRIKKCINSLAENFGEEAGSYKGKTYYNLPSCEKLASLTEEDLGVCRLGYRAKYLIKTAEKVRDEGIASLESLGDCSISSVQATETLRGYCGVGPKVANCIALFSLGKFDSFPIDVWVKKVMNELYGIDEKDVKGMRNYATEHFGEYGGIAQQYLFYYITHRGHKEK